MKRMLLLTLSVGALVLPGCAETGGEDEADLTTESAIRVGENEANPLPKIRKLVYETYGDEGTIDEFLAGMALVKPDQAGSFTLKATGAADEFPRKCSANRRFKIAASLNTDGSWTRRFSAPDDPSVATDPECNGDKPMAGRVEWRNVASTPPEEIRTMLKECVFRDVSQGYVGRDDERIAAMTKKVGDAISRNPRLMIGRGIGFTGTYFGLSCSVVIQDPVKQRLLAIQGYELN